MGRRTRTLVSLVTFIALLGTACTGSKGQESAKGGFLRVGTLQFPDAINPFNSFSADGFTVFEYVYPHLIQYDTRTLQFIPSFATDWNESSDGLTWTFHTVSGAKWSDGEPLTAADAAWMINTTVKFQSGSTSALSAFVSGISSAEAPDPTTLVIHMNDRSSYLLAALQMEPILPQHVWEQFATGKGTQLKAQTNIPTPGKPIVSGGPFMITQFKPHDIVLMSRNPNWYGPKPHIDGWGMQFFSESSAALQALENGNIDYINAYVPPAAVAPMKAKGFTIIDAPNIEQLYLDINSQHSADHPELGDPLVREAFSHAIDQEEIMKTAYLGFARPTASILALAHGNAPGTDMPWTDPSLKVPTFDLDLANSLLDQAGYKMGPGGVRIGASGNPMSYTVILQQPNGAPGLRTFSIMKSDFAQIGVELTPRVMDFGASFGAMFANHYSSFDMVFDDNDGPVDPNFILSSFLCSSLYSLNDAGWCNKRWDALYAKQAAAKTPQERVRLVYEMEKLFYDARTYIPIVNFDMISLASPRFTGYVPGPTRYIYHPSIQSLLAVHLAQ